MAPNHKLTKVIAGRTITGTANSDNVLTVTFDDGATMTVQTKGAASSAASGKIKAVRQNDTTLRLEFDDETHLEIPLAEATSSVFLRGKDGEFEYAD